MFRSVRRKLGFASFAVPFLLVAGVSACGDDPSDASPSTVAPLGPTNYVTQPQVTASTSTMPGETLAPGGTAVGEQQYRVQRGDAVFVIANRYDITASELASYNGWSDGTRHLLQPGDVIKIPPFAEVPDQSTDSTDPLEGIPDGPLCPDGSEQETYEIEAGDYLGRVANELDVTVEELNAANATTTDYDSFYVGLEIRVPCPDDGIEEESEAPATTEA